MQANWTAPSNPKHACKLPALLANHAMLPHLPASELTVCKRLQASRQALTASMQTSA